MKVKTLRQFSSPGPLLLFILGTIAFGLSSQTATISSHQQTVPVKRASAIRTPKASATPQPSPSPSPTPVASTTPVPKATPVPPTSTKPSTNPSTPKPAGATSSSDIASESACPGQSSVAQTSLVLACMTSFARNQHGIGPVAINNALTTAAQAKANDIVTCHDFSHTACNRAFDYWITQNAYPGHCDAENIAQGQQTPRDAFIAWMNSPGHRANILNPSYRDIGNAEAASSNGPVWVMELGGC